MKVILRDLNKYVLRFDPGDEVMGLLKKFCEENKIPAGHFTGIGAAHEVNLAFYELAHKRYQNQVLHEELEITGLTGNVATQNAEAIVHAHGTFSNRLMEARGGHILALVVSATCEIFLEALAGSISREPNPQIGLNLMK